MAVLGLLLRSLTRRSRGKLLMLQTLPCLLALTCYSVMASGNDENIFLNDHLTPYSEARHGSTRTLRDIATSQHVMWGNSTTESYQLSTRAPLVNRARYELLRFADAVPDGPLRRRYMIGTIAFIDNPYYALSVLEPRERDGCKLRYGVATRSTVVDTVSRRKHGCRLAANAGFFSMTSGQCLGNVVTDGHLVQTAGSVQNANFGIRQDGSMVIGYLSEADVYNQSDQFRQLVTGVIWLVRNGINYVNESKKMESSDNEETGKMDTFVNVLSARSAIGYDAKGRLVLAQVLGQTHQRG